MRYLAKHSYEHFACQPFVCKGKLDKLDVCEPLPTQGVVVVVEERREEYKQHREYGKDSQTPSYQA